MIEYLNPKDWSLHVVDGENDGVHSDWILVPDGAEVLVKFPYNDIGFYKNEFKKWWDDDGWVKTVHTEENLGYWNKLDVLWKRQQKQDYLVKTASGWEVQQLTKDTPETVSCVKIPEWANYAYRNDMGVCFLKKELGFSHPLLIWKRESKTTDNVNNPKHYNKGGVECIDAIKSSMSNEAFVGYLKGNVQKYMWRYEDKGGAESLKKAQWYLNKLIDELK